MKKLTLLTTPALALGLIVSLAACAQPQQQHAADSAAADPIVGQWQMTTLEAGGEGAYEAVPYSGQIEFSDAGYVSVQAMNPDVEAPDTAYTLGGYEAFYGPVEIDSDAETFTVVVESAIARDLIGQSLTRNFDVDGDVLVLTPSDPAEGWRVTYERQ